MQYKGLSSIDALRDRNSNYNLAYIAGESYLKHFRKKYFVSGDGILPDLISIGMKKDFCCRKMLDYTLNGILESGILNKFIEFDYFYKIIARIHAMDSENSYEQLSMKHFEGFFFLAFYRTFHITYSIGFGNIDA